MRSILFSLTIAPTALAVALTACAGPTQEPLSRTDLRASIGSADVDAIAVTIAPNGVDRYVFDRASGIHQIDSSAASSSALTLVMPVASMPDPGVEVRLPYTDLVALGNDQFAVTAIGDGFLLDVAAETMQLHFCYEPGWMPEDFIQRTDAVTYDPTRDQIIAQPQTFNEIDEVVSSDIGRYDRDTGADQNWHPLALDFVAGGMTVSADGTLYLGRGSDLYRYDYATNSVELTAELGEFGIDRIDGLAFDGPAGTLLIVDGKNDELVEVDVLDVL